MTEQRDRETERLELWHAVNHTDFPVEVGVLNRDGWPVLYTNGGREHALTYDNLTPLREWPLWRVNYRYIFWPEKGWLDPL